jgi:hypothetical protein
MLRVICFFAGINYLRWKSYGCFTAFSMTGKATVSHRDCHARRGKVRRGRDEGGYKRPVNTGKKEVDKYGLKKITRWGSAGGGVVFRRA